MKAVEPKVLEKEISKERYHGLQSMAKIRFLDISLTPAVHAV